VVIGQPPPLPGGGGVALGGGGVVAPPAAAAVSNRLVAASRLARAWPWAAKSPLACAWRKLASALAMSVTAWRSSWLAVPGASVAGGGEVP
jgi:hypothetical protein